MTHSDIASMLLGILSTSAALAGGLRMEQLTRITGMTATAMRKAMMSLVAAGIVRRTGNTRGTRYTAVAL